MHYTVALRLAKTCEDVTYEEWCDLYVSVKNPTREQIKKATAAAHAILTRNFVIERDVVIDQNIRDRKFQGV